MRQFGIYGQCMIKPWDTSGPGINVTQLFAD
jgi:hypothetical protein